MKSVAVTALCMFAAVAAEADAKPEAEADAYYGAYGYGLGHAYGYGLAHRGYYGYGAYPYAHHGYYYGKRSADAEAAPRLLPPLRLTLMLTMVSMAMEPTVLAMP